jgi:hypothetical protein
MGFNARFLEPPEPIEYPCCTICIQPKCPLDTDPNIGCPTVIEYKRKYDEFWAEKDKGLYKNWLQERERERRLRADAN